MKIIAKNGSDLRPISGEFSTTTLVELTPTSSLQRVPANVVLLIDSSSSMGGDKWQMVKSAVAELIESLSDDDRVAVVLFHASAQEVFPLASLAANRQDMKTAIQNLPNPSGVTNLEKGLKTAYDAFDARSSADKVKRVNHVILLTDGFPTDDQGYRVEKTNRYEDVVRKNESITLTGIGIGSADDYDASFISKLSELGRGSYYHANDLNKFKEGLKTEMAKLQASVVGDLKLVFKNVTGKVMRIARIAPEIVIYDVPGNKREFELPTGSMTKDLTSFLIQSTSVADGQAGLEIPLFTVSAEYDGKQTESINVSVKTTDRENEIGQIEADVLRGMQALQVHLNGEQIQISLASGDKSKATRLIENTTKLASQLGQQNVTRALTRMATDIKSGKSVSDDLATIRDEAKKTRLIIR